MDMKQELIEIICKKSFKYTKEPSFKLVSGRMSQFYVNCKPTTLSPRGMFLVGHLVFENIKDLKRGSFFRMCCAGYWVSPCIESSMAIPPQLPPPFLVLSFFSLHGVTAVSILDVKRQQKVWRFCLSRSIWSSPPRGFWEWRMSLCASGVEIQTS